MEHVVFFTDPQGASAFRRVPDRASASALVEQIVNESAGTVSPEVFQLAAVTVRMRTVFVAQLDEAPAATAAVAPEPVVSAEPTPVSEPIAAAEPATQPVAETPPVVAEPVAEPVVAATAEVASAPVEVPQVALDGRASFKPFEPMSVPAPVEAVAAEAPLESDLAEAGLAPTAPSPEPAAAQSPPPAAVAATEEAAPDQVAPTESLEQPEGELAAVGAGVVSGDPVADVVPAQDTPHVRSFGFFSR